MVHASEERYGRSANAEIVAAKIMIEIVVKRSLLAVGKTDSDETGAAGQRGCHLLDDYPFAPRLVGQVDHAITEAEKQTRLMSHDCASIVARRANMGFLHLSNTGG